MDKNYIYSLGELFVLGGRYAGTGKGAWEQT